MAKALPPRKSVKGLPAAPVITFKTVDNRELPVLTPMNFKVPADFHREFKLYAVQHGISMVDLLQESFRLLKDKRARKTV